VSGVYSQRHENREDLLTEEIIKGLAVVLSKVVPRFNMYVLCIEGWLDEVMESTSVTFLELMRHGRDVVEDLLG
jgi:hypothetical protein